MSKIELRELRLALQIPAKDIVAVIQELYPKYDKTMLSKCEHGEAYGVAIQPRALDALYEKFAPGLKEKQKRRRDGHRRTCRISCRLDDDDYASLKQCIAEEGFEDMQSWLTAMVRDYIKECEDK